jgi:long-chain fatty acid transport protein
MRHASRGILAVVVGWAMAQSPVAHATLGYFTLGYGAKSMGMAGAVVANPVDSLVASQNPAGMALVGERVDVGMRMFNPERKARLDTSVLNAGAAFGDPYDVHDKSRRNLFWIPDFGYNKKIGDDLWAGFTFYGNGGMSTTYDVNLYDQSAAVFGAIQFGIPSPPAPAPVPPGPGAAAFVPAGSTTGTPDTGTLGVELAQAILAPSLSFKWREKHNFGVALLVGIQRFSARGLGNFQCFTKSGFNNNGAGAPGTACAPGGFGPLTPGFQPSDKLTNNNVDWSFGAGARIGWVGEIHPRVTLGATAQSKVYMSKFNEYSELFAEGGDLDIPANYALGIAVKATDKLKLAFDFERIFYSGVNSISNPGPVASPFGPALPPGGGLLGADNGLGFGWENINIYRIGAEYRHNKEWTFRAGYAYNDQPIPDSQVLFNIVAPAVIKRHITAGFTYSPNASSEWTFAYMRALKETVSTDQTAFGIPGSIEMYQNSVNVGYSYKF